LNAICSYQQSWHNGTISQSVGSAIEKFFEK